MKNLIIIFFLIFINQSVCANKLFDTLYYSIEFSSDNIENDKIIEINKIKINSIQYVLRNTLTDNNFLEVNGYLTNDLINTFIKNIIINDEKIINDRYKSKIKINFNKNKIVDFFRSKKIPYIDYHPEKFLLIIYEIGEINNNLFSKNNNYYKYFNENYIDNKFFKIPNLDINDRFILSEKDIIKKDLSKINNFFNKYNSSENIIVIAKKEKNKKIYNLILYSDDKIIEKKIDFNNNEVDIFFKALENETLNLWKQINQIQNKNLNFLNCEINYYNMLELKEIRDNLKKISIINNLNINKMSYKTIEYDIYFYGNLKILFKIFHLNKLTINYNERSCVIKLK